jgi:hypothetical protein
MPNGKQIFKFLKEHGAAAIDEIVKETGMTPVDVAAAINEYAGKGYIERLPDGMYKVKFVLDPPLRDEPASTKFYDYAKIKEKIQGIGDAPPVSTTFPRKWRNPYLKYLPTRIDQGSRGTCVGYSTAIGLTLLYFDLTQDFPTPEELAVIQRNVEVQLGCANNKPFVHDIFPRMWKSAQFAYWSGRLYGNVTVPSGSYLSAQVGALKQYGCCFETECQTSKSAYCTTEFYPLKPGESTEGAKKRILDLAAQHKTDGYATTTNFETFCEAVYNKKWGLVPINIYANYMDNGCTGNYPEPRGECVGSHAQCVVGYDLDEGTIEFRQSWGTNWTDEGGISKQYWAEAAGAGLVVLDATETKVGQSLYSRVTISANVPCSYTINGEVHNDDPDVAALERGKTYEIVAFPKSPELVTASSLEIEITPTQDEQAVTFVFQLKTPEIPKKTLTEMIIEFFRMIMSIFGIK